jgi:hypothetical protein
MLELNCTIDQIDQKDIYRIYYSTDALYTFFSHQLVEDSPAETI